MHFHWHGDGEFSGLYLGHRLAHCVDRNLTEHLRHLTLGYYLVDLKGYQMSGMNSLFCRHLETLLAKRDELSDRRALLPPQLRAWSIERTAAIAQEIAAIAEGPKRSEVLGAHRVP
jgi:hypothetical protein